LLDPLIGRVGEKEALRQASPITYVHPGAPPFLLIQGDQDEYIPYTEDTNLQTALRKVGVRCDIIRIPAGNMELAVGTNYRTFRIGSAKCSNGSTPGSTAPALFGPRHPQEGTHGINPSLHSGPTQGRHGRLSLIKIPIVACGHNVAIAADEFT
jgi:hypothetical protein